MSVLQKLTEGIVNRNLNKEGAALMDKWERTGLLEGLDGRAKDSMSLLLENQAKELLREASSMAAGDVEGFAAVAFPIVRRVFGGLIANDLVSVQPMSLPSGLIFFLDFTTNTARLGSVADKSVYGGGVVASEITGGVSDITEDGGGFYNMANAYSSPTGSATMTLASDATYAALSDAEFSATITDTPFAAAAVAISALTEAQKIALRYDPDLLAGGPNNLMSDTVVSVTYKIPKATADTMNFDNLGAFNISSAHADVDSQLRRLTHLGYYTAAGVLTSYNKVMATGENVALTMYHVGTGLSAADVETANSTLNFPLVDNFDAANAIGAVVGNNVWGLEEPSPGTGTVGGSQTGKDTIAEIDIKVDSIAVTAITKKLKAKWSPELGQDLQAYHNLDAEVELTSILSEQIALEIDREILNDLVQGATAGTYHWSRRPGRFLDRVSGSAISDYSNESILGGDFTGTVSEWYETLVETINDVSAQIHRKTLRGGANFLVTSPEVANLLEFTSGFRASITHDDDKGNVGAVKAGNLSKKWDVYVDPYFLRNVVLVGRRGGSFLESGYVYSPYVPLQVTPTIFGTEDFVPRKGVMTRYAKKMVRPDMYGLVVIQDFGG